jgi:hypothetical protein
MLFNQKTKNMRFALIFLFVSMSLNYASAVEKCIVSITNPLNKSRVDEAIVLKKELLPKSFREILPTQSIIIETLNGVVVPNQLDDLNADGDWDEMAFLYTFKADESVQFLVHMVEKSKLPKFTQRAHVHLGVSRKRDNNFTELKEEARPKDHIAQSVPFLYQYEGPGWENDKLAFRTYFDSRNGKDVFGKLIPAMVLDSVGLPGKSYHKIDKWGMDVLKVGKSLGAGALALTDGDSLYRLAQTDAANYKVISDGPIRAIFTLTYTGWPVKEQKMNIIEQITVWGGKNYFSGKISVSGLTDYKYSIVTGITTLHLIDTTYQTEFLKSDNYSAIAINNVLSENKDFLALGLLVANNDFKNWKQAPETGTNDNVVKTSYIAFNTKNSVPVEYFLFAGWEQSDIRFKTEKMLNKLIVDEANKMNNPLIIRCELNAQ